MIICLCANMSNTEIEEEFKKGKSLEQIMDETGLCSGCYTCKEELTILMEEISGKILIKEVFKIVK